MDIALLVAKILGVYLVVSGLFLIFRGKTVPHLLRDFFDHPALLYLSGVILLFLSTLYLLQNNVWDGTWRTVITVIAWAVLVKGVSYILFPGILYKIANKKIFGFVSILGVIAVVAGVVLFYIN